MAIKLGRGVMLGWYWLWWVASEAAGVAQNSGSRVVALFLLLCV